MQSLEIERKRADSLLYRMIPKQIADRLRKGDSTLNTCEVRSTVLLLNFVCPSSYLISNS